MSGRWVLSPSGLQSRQASPFRHLLPWSLGPLENACEVAPICFARYRQRGPILQTQASIRNVYHFCYLKGGGKSINSVCVCMRTCMSTCVHEYVCAYACGHVSACMHVYVCVNSSVVHGVCAVPHLMANGFSHLIFISLLFWQ